MTNLEIAKDQLELALNEIKNSLAVEQGELIYDYLSEALKQVKKCSVPDVGRTLPDLKNEIDNASENFMDSFQPLEDNECSWQVVDESFRAGVDWLVKRLKGN
jgi:hypothetical protein